MAQLQAPTADPEAIRFIEPVVRPIVMATDLGNVQVLKHGNLYLLTDQFGDIHADSRGLGLYEADTRRLSSAILRVGGERPVLLQASSGANYRGSIQLTNPSMQRRSLDELRPEEALASQLLGIRRHRLLCGGVFEERIQVVNYSEQRELVALEQELGADAADIFEVRGWSREARGVHLPIAVQPDRVTFRYDGLDGVRRSTLVAFSEPAESAEPVDAEIAGTAAGGWIRYAWTWSLAPGESRELRWVAWGWDRNVPKVRRRRDDAQPDGRRTNGISREGAAGDTPRRIFPPVPEVEEQAAARSYRAWGSGIAEIRTDNELFNLVVAKSAADLRLLVNDGPRPKERYIAAGVPWFTTLFGRDALITALQSIPFRPQLAVETLEVLAARQAEVEDPVRDAEPGKILHEWRDGEMARNGEIPHTPYYGTADATPLWLILLGATWDWTGDRALVDRLWPNALRALEWIDRYGDRDGDGFVEYERRTEGGLLNQGWKDSHDSMRDRHGREVRAPIALAEVQGYVYDAKRRMAALARMRDETGLAERLDTEATTLRERFDAAFWVEDQGYYAMALDGDKRQADGLGSNAGQCLWTGIIPAERAARVAGRLLGPDLFSGWGIRTYAAGQPGYNPIGYHTGTVWPHDTSLIAAGLKRYGFHEEANQLVGRMFEAAQHFPDYRLPELFCGFDRDVSAVPVPYPVACSPQAWAAAATFMFLETMLGMRPDAASHGLELHRPQLPDWIGRVNISNLHVGNATVDLLFHRWRGGTSAEVLRKHGALDVTIRI
jgi:glycogen debranching enzyme